VARPGETLENPVTGERVVFRKTTAETNGEALEYELHFTPTGFVTQEHVHPGQSERHEVVGGALGLVLDGREQVLRPGDSVVVPRGARHRLFPVDGGQVHVVFELRPALRTETLLETFVGLARDGKVNRKGYPSLLQLAVISREFEAEGYATRPPLAVQRALFTPLAALGRRRGYRARYPQYSGGA
jgi:quercetin dioxygenase-like cupin family protein